MLSVLSCRCSQKAENIGFSSVGFSANVANVMDVETFDLRTLPDAVALEIAELLVRVWPNSEKTVAIRKQQLLELGQKYAPDEGLAPQSFLIRESGRLIAHSAVLPRSIGSTEGDLQIAGLTKVCTCPEHRGRGLGEEIVRPVFDLVDQGDFQFSLFQTTQKVRPFYEKLGACTVDNPIVNSLGIDHQESPFWDKVIMRYPKDRAWPQGEIDMRGPGY